MADHVPALVRNRRFTHENMGRRWIIFVGDCSQIGEVLTKKPTTPLWAVFRFMDSFFRTYGQVVFCNNPVSGLMIFLALIYANAYAASIGMVTVVVAILTALLVDQPYENVRAGLCSYNALLLGQLSAVLLPAIATIDWMIIITGAVLSVYFSSACGTLLRHLSKDPLPSFTVPFVVAQVLVYSCAMAPALQNFRPIDSESVKQQLLNGTYSLNRTAEAMNESLFPSVFIGEEEDNHTHPENSEFSQILQSYDFQFEGSSFSKNDSQDNELDWGEICTGMLRALAQVYGQNDLPASLLMLVGVVISSPITACMGLLGAVISTLMGVVLGGTSEETARYALYLGQWGFNGFLSAGAVGGFALVLTPHAAMLAFVASLLAGVLQGVLTPAFLMADVPLTTLPFNLSALLLLCVNAGSHGTLVRPSAISYPEKHRRDWLSTRDDTRQQDQIHPSSSGEVSVSEDVGRKEEIRTSDII